MDAKELVPTGMAVKRLRVHPHTLKAWRKAGKIKAEQTAAGRWLWDVDGFLATDCRGRPWLAPSA